MSNPTEKRDSTKTEAQEPVAEAVEALGTAGDKTNNTVTAERNHAGKHVVLKTCKSEPTNEADFFDAELPTCLNILDSTLSIPKGSVKRVLKVDSTVKQCASDAVYLLAKAAECFVTELAFVTAKEVENSPRKVIQYVNVFNAFMKVRENGEKDWRFLDEILPPKKRMKKD